MDTSPPAIANGNGLVFSDLHLGQPGSQGRRALATLHTKIDALAPSLIVLNGDIIDGTHPKGDVYRMRQSIDKGVHAVRTLIEHAVAKNPDCKVVYVFGNHDTYHEIRDSLELLHDQDSIIGHLQLEESMFRCRDTVFLHGDLHAYQGSKWAMLAGMVRRDCDIGPGVSRGRPEHGGKSGWKQLKPNTGMRTVKQAIVTGVSRIDQHLSPLFLPLASYANAIISCLKSDSERPLDGVSRVLMGHIHAPYGSTYQHPDNIDFLVTGPGTACSHNSMYQFSIQDNALSDFTLFSDRTTSRPKAR